MTLKQWLTPWRIACGLVLVLSGFVYVRSMTGMAVWDDVALISGDGIGGGHSLLRVFTRPFLGSYFRPLVGLTFYLERKVWGSGPFGYHQTNLLIHVLNTALMISLLRAAFKDRRIALLGALLFAVHPVHVSAVAWIGGRTDPMVCLFMTLFALWLIRALQAEGRTRAGYFAGSIAAYFLALLCKEQMLAALPLVPMAFRFFGDWRSALEQRRERLRVWAAFVAVSAVFVVGWWLIAPPKQGMLANGVDNVALRIGNTLFAYAALLVAPTPVWMNIFTLNPLERYGWISAIAGFGAFAMLSVYTVVCWRRRSQGAWWAAWILLTLLPVSNFLPIATLLVAPYRSEAAQIASAALMAWGLVALWDRRPLALVRWAGATAAAAFLLWNVGLSWWGSSLWQTPETFWRALSRLDPDCVFSRSSLVAALMERGRLSEARAELEMLFARLMPGEIWTDAGRVRALLRSDPVLISRLRQNQGGSIDPSCWMASLYSELGQLRLRTRDARGAEAVYRLAINLEPKNIDAMIGLGYTYLQLRDHRRALVWANQAVANDPDVSAVHGLRAECYTALGRWKEARQDYEYCVRRERWAGHAFMGLAECQLHLGDVDGAIATLHEALRLSPGRTDFKRMLAQINHDRSQNLAPMPAEPQDGAIRQL